MIYPSIDKLLNIVSSKYELVHIAARRSKEMTKDEHYQLALNQYPEFLYEPIKGKTNLQLFIEDKNLEAVRHAIKAVPNVFSQIPINHIHVVSSVNLFQVI